MEIVIGCSAAMLDGRKILLIKRNDNGDFYPGCWTFPGGRLEEKDVSAEEAAAREVKEEVGLDFIPEGKFRFYETRHRGRIIFSLVFLGEWKGQIKLQDEEASEYGWFDYEQAKGLEMAFSYRKAVDDLRESGIL